MDYIMPFVPDSVKNIPTHMDFEGQKKAEKLFQIIIGVFAAVGFVWGYVTQFFSQTLYILFAGVILSSVLTLIPWGMYRRQTLKWQPARDEDSQVTQSQTTTPSIGNAPAQSKPKKKKLKD